MRYPEELLTYEGRKVKQLAGLSGGISRAGYSKKHAFDVDQLYNFVQDPEEQNNLADSPEHKAQLRKMKGTLTQVLKQFPERPYGEFIPGGNARGPEASEPVLKELKKFYAAETASKGKKEPAGNERNNKDRKRKNKE